MTTTNAVQINRREYGENTCLGSSLSRTGIYFLYLLIDFSSVCCSLSRWLSLGNQCGLYYNGMFKKDMHSDFTCSSNLDKVSGSLVTRQRQEQEFFKDLLPCLVI